MKPNRTENFKTPLDQKQSGRGAEAAYTASVSREGVHAPPSPGKARGIQPQAGQAGATQLTLQVGTLLRRKGSVG